MDGNRRGFRDSHQGKERGKGRKGRVKEKEGGGQGMEEIAMCI